MGPSVKSVSCTNGSFSTKIIWGNFLSEKVYQFTQFLTKKHKFADLFSLHIFVRLKDLHGWKQ